MRVLDNDPLSIHDMEARPVNRKKKLLLFGGVPAAIVLWWLFRPELIFLNETVNEAFPLSSAMASHPPSFAGDFHDGAHKTVGRAEIHEFEGGKRVLRLSGFETSNGPDVRVLLVAAGDVTDSDGVKKAGFVEVAKLKGNVGDQNYDIPAEADFSKHRAVTIWCNRFGVNFGTAPLRPYSMAGASALASGTFHSVAHETTGDATIYRVEGGKRVLRLTNFKTSNGPDVRVFLVAAGDASDADTVKKAGYVEVGKLKGNVGDQNYDIPADVDLAKYRAVTIWCNRFGVNFATAPLARPSTGS